MIGDKTYAESVYKCKTNSAWFEAWFEFYLLPQIPQNTVITMDNATFHRKKILQEIIDIYNMVHGTSLKLLFLPPYSPDKNPIEKLWANMKKWLKKWANTFKTIEEAILSFFKQRVNN